MRQNVFQVCSDPCEIIDEQIRKEDREVLRDGRDDAVQKELMDSEAFQF